MKLSVFLVVISALLFHSCKDKSRLELPDGGLSFRISQRNTEVINEHLSVSIGDITGGMTALSIKSGSEELYSGFISEGASAEFVFDKNNYSIQCRNLENNLIGNDYADFVISYEETQNQPEAFEKEIETILSKIENSDVRFIRNGEEYGAKEAADHLRTKYGSDKANIHSFEDFVRRIATGSSMTGKPYLIKYPDGKTEPLKDWIRNNH